MWQGRGRRKLGKVLVLMIWDVDGQVAYLRARDDGREYGLMAGSRGLQDSF
ncbi:hypothetical protein [Anaerovibrio slackiae]|uniref:hypothetical protein n=1 Tax=Anaerovibrio slackiae TaxID=2652309 RepID=UPI003866BFFE